MAAALADVRGRLHAHADPERARFLEGFFKTGPGEYGEGDRFLGLRVPQVRALARDAAALPLGDLTDLLRSPFHEERLLALLALVRRYARADEAGREAIYRVYLAHSLFVNNWDLVDASAPHIVGAHLSERGWEPAEQLARSPSVWERRIAVLATFYAIRRGEPMPALRVAEWLVHDPHDLIHKAAGWMLREVGKRDREVEEAFLREHAATMPRTMLRYAVERFPDALRRRYLRER